MANPTASQVIQIRFYVPETWTPAAAFNAGAVVVAFQQYGTVHATALALCERKLAEAIENPDTFSISGEYSQSSASGVAALRARIKTLQELVNNDVKQAGSALIVYPMCRVGGPQR